MAELTDLVTGAEIGRRIGVSRERIRQLAQRAEKNEDSSGFPAPVGRVGASIVWRWPDVEAWARAEGRQVVAA